MCLLQLKRFLDFYLILARLIKFCHIVLLGVSQNDVIGVGKATKTVAIGLFLKPVGKREQFKFVI
jgi:hypothetical protein